MYSLHNGAIDILDKLVSIQHFERIKCLFNVQSIEQLKKIISDHIENNKEKPRRYSGLWDYNIRSLEEVIDINKIGTIK